MNYNLCGSALFVLAILLGERAEAQANANATSNASDAFGFKSGDDAVGIYDESSVRGFSLEAAGNYRVEGGYFVKNSGVSSFFLESTTVRIGYNTLNTILPGPSGVVDFKLRDPARDEPSFVNLTVDIYGQPQAELLLKHRTADDRASFSIGTARVFDVRDQQGGEDGKSFLLAGTARLTFEAATVRLFGGDYRYRRPGQFRVLAQGAEVPPAIPREKFLGQRWAMESGQRRIAGLLVDSADLGGFGLGGTLVFGLDEPARGFLQLFGDLADDRTARSTIIATPSQRSKAWSGELRGHYQRTYGDLLQRIDLAARGRIQRARFGASTAVDLGRVEFGEPTTEIPEPDFAVSPAQSRDKVDQWGIGATYRASWKEKLRVNVGVLRTDYRKTFVNSAGASRRTAARPWLYNAAAAWRPLPAVEFFGGYIKGLEEAGVAPGSAANRNEVLDAIEVTQRELGIRILPMTGLTAVLAGFDTRKPYNGIDGSTNIYRELGHVRHRGIEASVSGRPFRGLSLVVGGVVIDPILSGPEVSAGRIGDRPVGVPRWRGIASVDFALPWVRGLSIDGALTMIGTRAARSVPLADGEQLEVEGLSSANFGLRYSFRIGKTDLVARAQMLNAFDHYSWEVNSAETLNYSAPRRFKLVLTTFF